MVRFGWRLENLREKTGYSKKEISLKLGFSANVYGSYEREERRPSLETIIKLAEIFDVSLDYLIRGEEHTSEDITRSYKAFLETINVFQSNGMDHPYILDTDKWKILKKEDLEELTSHFEWIKTKAEQRHSENKR